MAKRIFSAKSSVGVRPATTGGHPRVRRRVTMWAALGVLALLATLLTPLSTASAQETAPSAPDDLRAAAGDKSVTLTWTPRSDGGATIIRWEFQVLKDGKDVNRDGDYEDAGETAPDGDFDDTSDVHVGWRTITNSGPTTTSYTVRGLDNGTTYRFEVRAVNKDSNENERFGASARSAAVSPAAGTKPVTRPTAAPSSLSAINGETNEVTLKWTDLSDDEEGGVPITWQYQIKVEDGDYYDWTPVVDPKSITDGDPGTDGNQAGQEYVVTGLTNGTTYQFKVRASNALGGGPDIESSPTLVATKPSKPLSLTAAAGDSSATLSWKANYDGGSTIVSWQYRLRSVERANAADNVTWPDWPAEATDPNWITIPDATAATTSYIVTDLCNHTGCGTPADATDDTGDTLYQFQVRAINILRGKPRGLGISSASTGSKTVDPGEIPGAPTGLTAVAVDAEQASVGDVNLSWVVPTEQGDNPIKSYQYSVKAGDGAWGDWTDTGKPAVTKTVEDLAVGVPHLVRVRANNGRVGDYVQLRKPVYPGTTPSLPSGLMAESSYDTNKGQGTITLSWAPGYNGGSPVTRWEYLAAADTAEQTGFTILADALGHEATTDGTLAWNPICDATNPKTAAGCATKSTESFTDLKVYNQIDIANATPQVDEWLRQSGRDIYIAIRAVNDVGGPGQGEGEFYNFAIARFKDEIPSAPQPLAVASTGTDDTTGNNQITLIWAEPANVTRRTGYNKLATTQTSFGGSSSDIYEYQLKVGDDPWGSTWSRFDDLADDAADTATDIFDDNIKGRVDLEEFTATEYSFRVRAKNKVGPGHYAEIGPITIGAPGTPGAGTTAYSRLLADADNQKVTLSLQTAPGLLLRGIAGTYETCTSTNATCTGGYLRNASFGPDGEENTADDISAAQWQYSYKYGDGDYGDWENTDSFDSTNHQLDSPIEVHELANGQPYTFRVRAVNGSSSSPILTTETVRPSLPPPAPQNVKAEGGNQQVKLTWVNVSDDGAPVKSWEYCGGTSTDTCKADGPTGNLHADDGWKSIPNAEGDATSFDFTGKLYRHSYTVTIGNEASVMHYFYSTDGDDDHALLAGTDGIVAAGNTPVMPPVAGTTITTAWTGTPTEVDIPNGERLTFRVRAVNTADLKGAIGEANPVTPGRTPSEPVRVLATPRDQSVDIFVTAPKHNNGTDITRYEIRKKTAEGDYDAWETLTDENGQVAKHVDGRTATGRGIVDRPHQWCYLHL